MVEKHKNESDAKSRMKTDKQTPAENFVAQWLPCNEIGKKK